MAASVEFQFWQFSSNFLVEFFKNHVKHQKITQKNIRTYIINVKFPAEHDPAVKKKLEKSWKAGKLEKRLFIEKFIPRKSTLIKIPKLAEVYFKTCTLRSHSYRVTYSGKQTIYSH